MRRNRRSETNELGGPGPQRQDSAEQYCAASTDVLPARGEESWIYNPARRQLMRVPEHLAGLLPHLSLFRSFEEHKTALRQAGWQEDGSGFLEVILRELVEKGLLRSRSSFLANLQSVGGSCDSPPGITSAGWVTCNRRALLQESLQGFSRSFLAAGRRIELKVFDDSQDSAEREATRGMLAELGRQTGLPAHYSGAEEKRAFAAELTKLVAKEGIRPELVEFALFDPCGFGYTVGANLNAFLLGTQGELALKLDDDTFCRFASPPQPEEGMALETAPDPTRVRLFPDAAVLALEVTYGEADILHVHEALLGRSVAECVKRQGAAGRVRCEGVGTELLQLLENRPARVAATMAGICGDSGMFSSRYFLSLIGPERERLVESEEGYRACLASRQLLRVAPALTISPRDVFMSTNCGFDHRQLLPPFFPGLRNSDGLFAVTLRACSPESLIGHLPLAVEHRPPEPRHFEDEDCRTLSLRLADLLILLVHSFPACPVPSPPEVQLPALGRYLVGLASAQPGDFDALARRLWAAELSAYTLHLERLLANYQGEPGYWAEDVEDLLERVARQAAAPPGLPIVDLPGQGEGAPALVRRFGELLIDWPALAEAARRL